MQMKKRRNRIKMNEDKKEIKNKALKLLSRREHSRRELKDKLLRRDFNFQNVEVVLEDLSNSGYLNDRRFARTWIKNRLQRKPRGKALIEAELRDKGVDGQVIEEELNNLLSEQKEKAMCEKLARKWLNKKNKKISEDDDLQIKLMRYLSSRGFSKRVIRKVLSELS